MLKEILRKAVTQIQTVVIVLALLALVFSGVFSAERTFGSFGSTDRQAEESLPENAQLLPGPPLPDEIPQNMTPSGKPNSEAYAYFTAASLIDFSKVDSRLENGNPEGDGVCADASETTGKSQVRSSASEISSQLGLQFTLVGAKPSGTS